MSESRGGVREVSTDNAGRYFVGLYVITRIGGAPSDADSKLTPLEKQWLRDGYPSNVVCLIAPGAEKEFASFREGAPISIIAKVVGSWMADVWHGYLVEMEDARLSTPK